MLPLTPPCHLPTLALTQHACLFDPAYAAHVHVHVHVRVRVPPCRGARSGLAILRPGLALSELAVSPLPGAPTAVSTLKASPDLLPACSFLPVPFFCSSPPPPHTHTHTHTHTPGVPVQRWPSCAPAWPYQSWPCPPCPAPLQPCSPSSLTVLLACLPVCSCLFLSVCPSPPKQGSPFSTRHPTPWPGAIRAGRVPPARCPYSSVHPQGLAR